MKAAIDIGTNTTLLLVAAPEGNTVRVIEEEQHIPRLGAGVDQSNNLSESAMQRVINTLQEYQKTVKMKYPAIDTFYVTATSAVRDAQNKKHFLERVKKETGLQVQVLSGFEEALYTFLGAKSVLTNMNQEGKHLIIDIGGGSTEIALGGRQLRDRYSFDMGCVRFTERFLKDNPPTDFQVRECQDAIRNVLREHEFSISDEVTLIGVAGTVTSLAFIDNADNKKHYNREDLAGHVIPYNKMRSYITRFSDCSSSRLEELYPAVMKGRADIFLAGLLILDEFMNKYNFEELITSTGGIRHGAILVNRDK